VRNAPRIVHPVTGEAYNVGSSLQSQSFRRAFGSVVQYCLVSGLLKKRRLRLAAVRLESEAATPAQVECPTDELLRRIAGADGLDFREDTYHCVGIFSPVSWPDAWKDQAEIRGDALFFFVEKGEASCWNIFGPDTPIRAFFDPEDEAEKTTRAAGALSVHPRLAVRGDTVPLAMLLEQLRMPKEPVLRAIEASDGRFQVINNKGKLHIQRSSR
jgi:hypothetical protein